MSRAGRTFEMLGQAVAAAAAGHQVAIVAHSLSYANQLKLLVEAGLKAMGADMKLVSVWPFNSEDRAKDWQRGTTARVFVDHFYRWEHG